MNLFSTFSNRYIVRFLCAIFSHRCYRETFRWLKNALITFFSFEIRFLILIFEQVCFSVISSWGYDWKSHTKIWQYIGYWRLKISSSRYIMWWRAAHMSHWPRWIIHTHSSTWKSSMGESPHTFTHKLHTAFFSHLRNFETWEFLKPFLNLVFF